MTQPWDRREGETAKSFAAFQEFLRIPPKERSLLEVARRLYPSVAGKSREKQRSPSSLSQWSRLFDWESRAQAFDDDQHKRELMLIQNKRERHLLSLWRGMEEAVDFQFSRFKSATFDELTKWYNSMRSSVVEFSLPEDIDEAPADINVSISINAPPEKK